jgi:hypothetical protein
MYNVRAVLPSYVRVGSSDAVGNCSIAVLSIGVFGVGGAAFAAGFFSRLDGRFPAAAFFRRGGDADRRAGRRAALISPINKRWLMP